MDELKVDKLLRAVTAAGDASRAAADVLGVEMASDASDHMGMKRAAAAITRDAARTLRESAAILLQAAHAIDGLRVVPDTHDDEGR